MLLGTFQHGTAWWDQNSGWNNFRWVAYFQLDLFDALGVVCPSVQTTLAHCHHRVKKERCERSEMFTQFQHLQFSTVRWFFRAGYDIFWLAATYSLSIYIYILAPLSHKI